MELWLDFFFFSLKEKGKKIIDSEKEVTWFVEMFGLESSVYDSIDSQMQSCLWLSEYIMPLSILC